MFGIPSSATHDSNYSLSVYKEKFLLIEALCYKKGGEGVIVDALCEITGGQV